MQVQRFPLGQMQANCYLLRNEEACILIDPAESADFLIDQIHRNKLSLRAMIATHGHFDHIMAAGEIQLSLPEVPLYIHSRDVFLLDRVVETARHFLEYDPVVIPVGVRRELKAGIHSMHGFSFTLIETPGHTPGSCTLYFPHDSLLFTGDTLFAHGIGRSDFAYSDKQKLTNSLQRISHYPDESIVYAGHGEESTLGECKKELAPYGVL